MNLLARERPHADQRRRKASVGANANFRIGRNQSTIRSRTNSAVYGIHEEQPLHRIQADRFGPPSVLRYVESDLADPGPTQVRIRVRAAGVNPADTYVLSGTYAFYKPELPYTPGVDAAGVVDAIGRDVQQLRIGDRVFASALGLANSGGYAEYMICDSRGVHQLPGRLTFEQGAAIGVPYLTAYRALFQRGGAAAKETVLIHGASGGVGIPAVQLAADAGLTVIGTAGSEAGQALVAEAGARHVLDHTAAGYLDDVAELTDGHGADLVIEMLANENLERDFSALAKYGRIVVVGSRGAATFSPRLTMVAEADVRGTALWNMRPAEVEEAWAAIGQRLSRGSVSPVVGHSFPLRSAAAAMEHVMSRRASGRLILDCS